MLSQSSERKVWDKPLCPQPARATAEPGVQACVLPAAAAGASLVGPCEQPGGQWAPLGGRSRVRNGPAQARAPGQQEGVRERVTGLEVTVPDTGWGMPGPLRSPAWVCAGRRFSSGGTGRGLPPRGRGLSHVLRRVHSGHRSGLPAVAWP